MYLITGSTAPAAVACSTRRTSKATTSPPSSATRLVQTSFSTASTSPLETSTNADSVLAALGGVDKVFPLDGGPAVVIDRAGVLRR
jgi:hypothetical protein